MSCGFQWPCFCTANVGNCFWYLILYVSTSKYNVNALLESIHSNIYLFMYVKLCILLIIQAFAVNFIGSRNWNVLTHGNLWKSHVHTRKIFYQCLMHHHSQPWSANRVSGDLVWGHNNIITNNPLILSFIHTSPQNLLEIVKINLKTSTTLSYIFPLNLYPFEPNLNSSRNIAQF